MSKPAGERYAITVDPREHTHLCPDCKQVWIHCGDIENCPGRPDYPCPDDWSRRVNLLLGNRPTVARLDYALESPDSVPGQLRAFAARGFKRKNRGKIGE